MVDRILVQIPSSLCLQCLANSGITPPPVVAVQPQGRSTRVPQSQVASLQTFIANPPAVHNHPVLANVDQVAASDAWSQLTAQLAALPAPPTPPTVDPNAAIRARLVAQIAAAKTKVDSLGGLA